MSRSVYNKRFHRLGETRVGPLFLECAFLCLKVLFIEGRKKYSILLFFGRELDVVCTLRDQKLLPIMFIIIEGKAKND